MKSDDAVTQLQEHYIEELISDLAKQLGVLDPICVTTDFANSTILVGYMFERKPLRRVVVIQVGALASVLTLRELGAVFAHELAHIKTGYTSKLAFFALHNLTNVRNGTLKRMLGGCILRMVRFKEHLFGEKAEFHADQLATSVIESAALATALVKGSAFDFAVEQILTLGNLFGRSFDSQKTSAHSGGGTCDLQPSEIAQFIREVFLESRAIFELCIENAKLEDRRTGGHPRITDRLERLGQNWESTKAICLTSPFEYVDLSSLRQTRRDTSSA